MKSVREEHSILKLAEGIAAGKPTVTLDAKEARDVLDRVKNLEHALARQIRSGYERSITQPPKPKAS